MFQFKKNGRASSHSSLLHLHLPSLFAFTGLALQTLALLSDSWVMVEQFEPPYCQRKMPLPSDFYCDRPNYLRDEIARAGLWRVCYLFPYMRPDGHTDPYCADFADDVYPAVWLVWTQLVCLLSVSLAVLGLVILACNFLTRIQRVNVTWTGSALLLLGGLCGLVGAVNFYSHMKKEFLVYYDSSYMKQFTWWAFHLYLDGSLLSLVAGLLWGAKRTGRNAARRL